MSFRLVMIGFVIAVPLTVVSYLLLDQQIAIFIQGMILTHVVLKKITSNIPDLLLLVVLAITALSWAAFFFLATKNRRGRQTRFTQLCGVSAPLAYGAKAVLQYAFGRVNPKLWLSRPELAGFHWFPAAPASYGFPSGHMTVFTALAVVFCYIYPRYSKIYLTLLILLGTALVVSNYHFLSDVIFGAYLGLLVCYLADYGLTVMSPSYRLANDVS